MFHVSIIGANNLPIMTKKVQKTVLCVLSSSARRYYYDTVKNKQKTTYPLFDAEFDMEFFRANFIYLKLFAYQFIKQNIFIGEAVVDLVSIINKQPNNFYGSIDQPIHVDVPLQLCQSENAEVLLEFYYTPSIFPSIPPKSLFPLYHVFLTFNPPLPFSQEFQLPVEIELLQFTAAIQTKEEKQNNTHRVIYSHLNSNHDWESVGLFSNQSVVLGPTGYTPILSLYTDRLPEKALVFILNVHNYNGTATLNLLADDGTSIHVQTFDHHIFHYFKRKELGIVHSVDVAVQENTKVSLPLSFFFHQPLIKKSIMTFPISQLSLNAKSDNSESSEENNSEAVFHRNIANEVGNNVTPFQNSQMIPRSIPYNNASIPLQQYLQSINAPLSYNFRIYNGGSTTVTTGKTTIVYYWQPRIFVFDKTSGDYLETITQNLSKEPNLASKKLMDIDDKAPNYSIGLNLEEIGTDKIAVFSLFNHQPLESANPPGFVYIVQENTNEILFRNQIYPDGCFTYLSVLFRFEYTQNGWELIPMRHLFMSIKTGFETIIQMAKNDWVYPTESDEEKIKSNYKIGVRDHMKLTQDSYFFKD